MVKPRTHDEYIANAPAFAQPILERVRAAVHAACPEVVETIKWSNPHYEHFGMMVGISAHKAHVNLGFWRGTELTDPAGLLEIIGKTEIANMRLESIADLPPKRTLVKYVREAARLNEAAQAAPKKPAKKKAAKKTARSIVAPDDLSAALKKNAAARRTFEGFSYTNRKEYVDWLTEAKREATREKRLAQALEWMAEGKPRNWKYMKEWS